MLRLNTFTKAAIYTGNIYQGSANNIPVASIRCGAVHLSNFRQSKTRDMPFIITILYICSID